MAGFKPDSAGPPQEGQVIGATKCCVVAGRSYASRLRSAAAIANTWRIKTTRLARPCIAIVKKTKDSAFDGCIDRLLDQPRAASLVLESIALYLQRTMSHGSGQNGSDVVQLAARTGRGRSPKAGRASSKRRRRQRLGRSLARAQEHSSGASFCVGVGPGGRLLEYRHPHRRRVSARRHRHHRPVHHRRRQSHPLSSSRCRSTSGGSSARRWRWRCSPAFCLAQWITSTTCWPTAIPITSASR